MTAAQNRCFDSVKAFIARHGHSPSYSEVARGMGIRSLATVGKHIHALIASGYLVQGSGSSIRSLAIAPDKVLHGFHSCCRGHQQIFFAGACPMCDLILRTAREVSVAPSSPSLSRS